MFKTILIILLLAFTHVLVGQDKLLTVQQIQVEGNKKTKANVILRELSFQTGDQLLVQQLPTIAERNEKLVMNTSLFTAVDITFQPKTAQSVVAIVQVREFWYLFPSAIFQLADRNFSIWWFEQNRSLDRVNYGLRFYHNNLTGRGDKLRVITQLGYLKRIDLSYDLPMFRGSNDWGVFFDAHFSNQKEVAYITAQSRLKFFSQADESILLRRYRAGAGATYRKGVFQYHTAKLLYSDNWIGDSIAILNPSYFLNSFNRQQHFTLQYDFTVDKRDIKAYPISGFIFSAFAQKDGFGFKHEDINVFATSISHAHFFALGKNRRHSFGAKIKGRYTWNRQEQPYTHVSAVGYSPDVLKGYEFYVIDGMDYLYLKTHLVFSLLKKELNLGKWVFLEQFRHMPIQIYFTINSDWGYVNAPYNDSKSTISNEWLWGRGVGIDILMYYDKLMRFEYSFNHLGERGLFFSWDLAF
ncbi:MAG: POTRA domain-containing protein [Bacteroidota bacterium]